MRGEARPATEGGPPPAQTRACILAVAADLFAQEGFESTTVADICARAFISRGAFYHHFASKDAVLVALTLAEGPRIQLPFEAALHSDAPTPEVLAATVDYFSRDVAAAPRDVTRSVVRELVSTWSSEPASRSPLRDNLEQVMVRARQRGELPPGWVPEELAAVLFAVVFGAVVEWLGSASRPPEELEDMVLRRVRKLVPSVPTARPGTSLTFNPPMS